MFGLLRRWRKTETKAEREIFSYQDGTGATRRVDPVVLHDKIENDEQCPQWGEVARRAESGDLTARDKLLDLIRRAFGVSAYDEATQSGLTIAETFGLFLTWIGWCSDQKKSTGYMLTRSRPSENSPSENQSTTGPASGSCSTPTESPTGEPFPSCSPSGAESGPG